jgi:type II secretory pathway component PulF
MTIKIDDPSMSDQKPRRIRQRKPELMLQAALNDAEELSRATPTPENVERMRLVKTRLTVLKSRVNRKLQSEVTELTRRFAELEGENLRLRQALAARSTRRADPEIEAALTRYRQEKNNGKSSDNSDTRTEPSATTDEKEIALCAQ